MPTNQPHMIIDGRLPEGYVVVCSSSGDGHSFVVRRLGPSVECPRCGCTEISTTLAAEFVVKQSLARQRSLRSGLGGASSHGRRAIS